MELTQQELQIKLIEDDIQDLDLNMDQVEHAVILLDMLEQPTSAGQTLTQQIKGSEFDADDSGSFEINLIGREIEGQLIWKFVFG